MEILLGMILLLQVLVSIQLMLFHRQMLQQIKKVEHKLESIDTQKKSNSIEGGKMEEEGENGESLLQSGMENGERQRRKEDPEVLINEVLSEVFS